MAAVPYYTSATLIDAVKRKISFPLSQNTFTDDDVLAFANEEMMISQVPSVMQFHEEFFVTTTTVPLLATQSRYPIPGRAVGMKLRSLFWQDQNGNLFEMTRIHADDRAYFQRSVGANENITQYFFEGNDVVLEPLNTSITVTGNLVFVYYLRPNQLVSNDRAAIVNGFVRNIVVDNTTLLPGDNIVLTYGYTYGSGMASPLTVTLTATSGSPLTNEFLIGGNSIDTATNIVNLVNSMTGTTDITATNGNPSTNVITLVAQLNGFLAVASNTVALAISANEAVQFANMPTAIVNGVLIDFLQTDSGHKTFAFDIKIPASGVQGNIIAFNASDIPQDLRVGDYICLANECIIPQIPSDLHNGLAERTCARILAAIGDAQGLGMSNAKIQEIEQRQGTLIDNRSEGDPLKVLARNSTLRYGKFGTRRRV